MCKSMCYSLVKLNKLSSQIQARAKLLDLVNTYRFSFSPPKPGLDQVPITELTRRCPYRVEGWPTDCKKMIFVFDAVIMTLGL